MNETISFAQPAKVVGTVPVDLPTPALSKMMTSRSFARVSRNKGSLFVTRISLRLSIFWEQGIEGLEMDLPEVHVSSEMDMQDDWDI